MVGIPMLVAEKDARNVDAKFTRKSLCFTVLRPDSGAPM
jgi:hypothetical protein